MGRNWTETERITKGDSTKKLCFISNSYFRAIHNARPLEIDPKLTKFAQEWANRLSREDFPKPRFTRGHRDLIHRPNNPYGENLFKATAGSSFVSIS